jgi:hypothetical protein
VPATLADARAFFAALGWREEGSTHGNGAGYAGAGDAPSAAPVAPAHVRFVTEARPA